MLKQHYLDAPVQRPLLQCPNFHGLGHGPLAIHQGLRVFRWHLTIFKRVGWKHLWMLERHVSFAVWISAGVDWHGTCKSVHCPLSCCRDCGSASHRFVWRHLSCQSWDGQCQTKVGFPPLKERETGPWQRFKVPSLLYTRLVGWLGGRAEGEGQQSLRPKNSSAALHCCGRVELGIIL